jgi:hypothetical protein
MKGFAIGLAVGAVASAVFNFSPSEAQMAHRYMAQVTVTVHRPSPACIPANADIKVEDGRVMVGLLSGQKIAEHYGQHEGDLVFGDLGCAIRLRFAPL